MILTPKFVFIANPKTGSTSAEWLIFKAWSSRPIVFRFFDKLLIWSKISGPRCSVFLVSGTKGVRHKHANFTQIPDSHRNLPVIATFRNPTDWIASHLRYDNDKHVAENILGKEAPKSIATSINNYLEYGDMLRTKHSLKNKNIGYFTFHFINQMHHDPDSLFLKLNDGESCQFDSFSRIKFMHFPHQIDDLKSFMDEFNFCTSSLSKLPDNIIKNRSLKALTSQEEQIVKKYTENHEPMLVQWYSQFKKNLENAQP